VSEQVIAVIMNDL